MVARNPDRDGGGLRADPDPRLRCAGGVFCLPEFGLGRPGAVDVLRRVRRHRHLQHHRRHRTGVEDVLPREALPLAAVLSFLPELAIGVVTSAAIIAYQGGTVNAHMWALMLPIVVAIVWTALATLVFGILAAFIRDMVPLSQLLLRVGVFATPVMYESSVLPPSLEGFATYNPIAVAIEESRAVALCGSAPRVLLMLGWIVGGLCCCSGSACTQPPSKRASATCCDRRPSPTRRPSQAATKVYDQSSKPSPLSWLGSALARPRPATSGGTRRGESRSVRRRPPGGRRPKRAGKSTLLRVLSGITRLTSGYAEVTGSVSEMIELGVGFHTELTGQRTSVSTWQCRGVRSRQANSAIAGITEFSGLSDAIDEPVRTYSSGMMARLGFAVSTHFRPDLLLVDEILAVGDRDFQMRCIDRICRTPISGQR